MVRIQLAVDLAFADDIWCATGSPAVQAVLAAAGITGLQQCWRAWFALRRKALPDSGKMTTWLREEHARLVTRRLLIGIATTILLMLPFQGVLYVLAEGERCKEPLSDSARQVLACWLGLLAAASVLAVWLLILRAREVSR